MSQLTPCPACSRHVRKTETQCPFCGAAVSLAHVPAPVLPSSRLGRAATFAFGASIATATALVSCSADDGPGTAVYGGPPVPSAGAGGDPTNEPGVGGKGGTAGAAGAPEPVNLGGVYGSPPPEGGAAGAPEGGGAPAGGDGGVGGEPFVIYGGPPGGAAGTGS